MSTVKSEKLRRMWDVWSMGMVTGGFYIALVGAGLLFSVMTDATPVKSDAVADDKR